jgi:predicted dehydrogenase
MQVSGGNVRTAIVGLGKFAHDMAKACRATDRIELAACYSRTPATVQAFAEAHGTTAAPSFETLLADPRIEAVLLVTPNCIHCEQTIAAARAGKHVFVEKPLCNRLDEADRMVEACAQAGVLLAVGHQERRHSPYRYIKDCIQRGLLGRIHAFEANHCGNLLAVWPEDDWRFKTHGGGGPILHKGTHKIDILNYLFGEAEAVATLGTPLAFNPAMDATTVSTLRFSGGILGSLSTGFAHTSASLNVYGELRSVSYSGYGTKIEVKDERTWAFETVDCGPDQPLVEELAEFAEAVRGRAKVEVDGAVARETLRLALALQDASTSGRVVDPRTLGCASGPGA